MMGYATITFAVTEGIATLTLNRPSQLNAINREMVGEMGEALDLIEREGARVLLVTGAGGRAFSAGADVHEFRGMGSLAALTLSRELQNLFGRVENLPVPVIAAVDGYAVGGGCELALACDIVYASERSRFGQPEITLGVIPGAGGTQRLPRLVGERRAKEMIYSGEMIDAAEAWRIGLVNRVCPPDRLMAEAQALAGKIAATAPLALRVAKEVITGGRDLPLSAALLIEARSWAFCFDTADKEEGVAAFLEKRTPHFQGR